jgi:hypothetical protein
LNTVKISPTEPLPESCRGNSWFWPMMEPGESGVEFAMRQPEVRPGDLKNGELQRWTKVNPGGVTVLLVDGHLFKCPIDKHNRIQWVPECFQDYVNTEKGGRGP